MKSSGFKQVYIFSLYHNMR